jgi:hypothetical protein
MKSRLAPFLENITESGAACLITMVQGNLFALTVAHWMIASRTGVVAGTLASVALLVTRTTRPWVVLLALAVMTAVVDFFVHPGQFGPIVAEALVTGAAAGVLSFLAGALVRRVKKPAATTA